MFLARVFTVEELIGRCAHGRVHPHLPARPASHLFIGGGFLSDFALTAHIATTGCRGSRRARWLAPEEMDLKAVVRRGQDRRR